MQLKIIPLGGTTGVNKNLFVYEYGNDIIVVDCGVGFPDSADYGVDLVIPDFSYLLDNRNKVRAVLITHGHEDHFGAVPFLLNELKVPVYSSKLVSGFIQNKLNDYRVKNGVNLRVFSEEDVLHFGVFNIIPISVNHSVPDTFAFAISGPFGLVLHVSDFKFDWTPVMDKPFDIAKLSKVAGMGVDVLLSDCLGSTSKGYTESERFIENTFNELISKAKGSVFITTMSSNISRIYQAINSSQSFGRKVVISGRSIEQNITVATRLGYLNFPKDIFVSEQESQKMPSDKLTYIVAGSYGQTNSALFRIATDKHKNIKLQKGAVVIFSADPSPPGVLEPVNYVIDQLTLRGADVVYSEIQDNLHVSGHGSIGDISMLAGLVNPKYFIPIGGTVKYMRAYKNLMVNMGFNKENVFELLDGEGVTLENKIVKRGEKVHIGNVYVDGSGIGDVGSIVLRDRQELADSGMVVIAIPFNRNKNKFGNNVSVVSRGFVYVKESKKLISDVASKVRKILAEYTQGRFDVSKVKERVEREVAKYLYKVTERTPIVLVVTVEV